MMVMDESGPFTEEMLESLLALLEDVEEVCDLLAGFPSWLTRWWTKQRGIAEREQGRALSRLYKRLFMVNTRVFVPP